METACNIARFLVKIAFTKKNLLRRVFMARVCQVTGKRPISGNNVSHSNRKTRRRFLPNLSWHRIWVQGENKFIRLLLSSQGLRIIDKKGIEEVLLDLRARGEV